MAVDPAARDLMRADLAALEGITERPMFGGLGFMRAGHMLAGVMSSGALLCRVGKPREAEASAPPGAAPMQHGGRRMGGFVMLAPDAFDNDATRAALIALALKNAAELPPKE